MNDMRLPSDSHRPALPSMVTTDAALQGLSSTNAPSATTRSSTPQAASKKPRQKSKKNARTRKKTDEEKMEDIYRLADEEEKYSDEVMMFHACRGQSPHPRVKPKPSPKLINLRRQHEVEPAAKRQKRLQAERLQAVVRGFLVRRRVLRMMLVHRPVEPELVDSDGDDEEGDGAAGEVLHFSSVSRQVSEESSEDASQEECLALLGD